MNNKEMYKRTFGKLQTSHVLDLEEFEMNKKSRGISGFRMRKSVLICGILICLMIATQCVTFAATGSGVIGHMKVLVNGSEQNIQPQDGKYKVKAKAGDSVKFESEDTQVEYLQDNGSSEVIVDENNTEIEIKDVD